jgi:organic radical activating enzyme
MEDWAFDHFLIQPMDSLMRDENLKAAIDFVMDHPRWRLSLQTHKALGLP